LIISKQEVLLFFQIDHLVFRHAGLSLQTPPTLNDLTIEVNRGEWIALVGANGSGKTTLARMLNGLLQPQQGRVLVDGLDTREAAHLSQIRARVGMVFQSPEDQIISSLVKEDTAFGLENLGIPANEINRRVEEALKAVGMWEARDRAPHLLSAGQIQRVALAGVLAMQPECIIFDESTAMLDPRGKQDVLAQMQQLHARGMTVIMITHSMDEALLAQRVLLLDHGQLAFDGSPQALFSQPELVTRCHLELPFTYQVNQLLQSVFHAEVSLSASLEQMLAQIPSSRQREQKHSPQWEKGTAEIEVERLSHTYMAGTPMAHVALHEVSFAALTGQAHALIGATGSGKSTLLQHLNGLYLPQAGKVRVGKFDLADPQIDLRQLRHHAGLVFQNPELYFFEQYVGDEIAYGAKLYYGREGLRERVQLAMQQVGLDFEVFKDRFTNTLSGGEKRKVALASALVIEPQLLILDEPTAGLDPQSRQGLLQVLNHLQVNGRQLVLSSHNMEDITALAKRATVMAQGTSLVTDRVAQVFLNSSLLIQAGLSIPASAQLNQALKVKGWELPEDCFSLSQMKTELLTQQGGNNE
jgi:energy-coupling factor transport system ATP-binding protein